MSFKTHTKSVPSVVLALAIGGAVTALSGCATTEDPDRNYRTDLASLENNISPELYNTAQTRDEAMMDWAVNRDQDTRGIYSDIGRFWLTDKPSNLSPYPIMQTNGNP
ncbi:MAG: hypothetical protein RL136_239 [Planctomycetota bacterium]|jgi:hypothetical protein